MDNMKDKDLKRRFIEQGKVICNGGEKSVLIRKTNGKVIKKNIRDVKKIHK